MIRDKGETKQSTRLSMTGDEFKTLIEKVTQDNKLNTIPELFAFLNGIPQGMTLEEYINEHGASPEAVKSAVDEVMEENAKEAYDADNRRLYLFGRPKEEE